MLTKKLEFSHLRKWLLANRLSVAITASLIVACAMTAVLAMNLRTFSAPKEGNENTLLQIESDPAGITITGQPTCDSPRLHKITPYKCSASDKINTVLTAPDVVSSGGKVYRFKTWDGCSSSNADKKVCKVEVASSKSKTVEASYAAEDSSNAQPSAGDQSNKSTPTRPSGGTGTVPNTPTTSETAGVNDQSCTISTVPGRTYGLGAGYGFGSTTSKDSLCTLYERNPPSAGYNVMYDTVYDRTVVSCGDKCATYGQDQSIYHGWPSMINYDDCPFTGGPNTLDCFGGSSPDKIFLHQPTKIKLRALEAYSQYFGYGCKYYYCSDEVTFVGWNTSIDAGSTPSSPTTIHIVAKYKLVETVNPAYVSSPEADKTRHNFSDYRPVISQP
jgi:hypothetical protein